MTRWRWHVGRDELGLGSLGRCRIDDAHRREAPVSRKSRTVSTARPAVCAVPGSGAGRREPGWRAPEPRDGFMGVPRSTQAQHRPLPSILLHQGSRRSEATHESTRQVAARTGHLARERPRAQGRPQRRHDPHPQDRDLRHRHPHLHVGRVGAEDDPGADGRRPRVCGRDRRDRQRGAGVRDRRPRLRRRSHHLRLLPQLSRRPPASLPQHDRRRRQPPGLVRRVPGDSRPSTRSSCPRRSATTWRRSSIRSATRRTPRCRSTSSARTC